MLKPYRMDLHIHTCLSPCGMPENVPSRITARARDRNLQVIGVTDHNASENVISVRRAAARSGVAVLGGMEITTEEEIHVLAIFDNDDNLARMQKLVYENLPGRNDPAAFGEQYIVDEEDYAVGRNDRLLMGATVLPVGRTVHAIHEHGGLAVAAHIDRDSFSILSQLGMIPDDLELDGVELSVNHEKSRFDLDVGLPQMHFSDAHFTEEIGRAYTTFMLEAVSVEDIREALAIGQDRCIPGP